MNSTIFKVVRDGLGTWAVSCPTLNVYLPGHSCSTAQVLAARMNAQQDETRRRVAA